MIYVVFDVASVEMDSMMNFLFSDRPSVFEKVKAILTWFRVSLVNQDLPGASILTFVIVSGCMLIYTLQRADQPFYHDSLQYWELTSGFYEDGSFSVTNFANQLRGYLFPLLLLVVQYQADLLGIATKTLFAIYSALFFAVFTVHIVPASFRVLFGIKSYMFGRIACSFLFFFFWRGYFLYPLTDFPALAAFLVSLLLLAHVFRGEKSRLWLIGAGLLAGAAVNIRPTYQVSLLIVLVLFLWGWSVAGIRTLAVSMSLFLLGCAAVLLPQWVINQRHFDLHSPFVLANYGGDENLYQLQLFWGLRTQKYETNVGDNFPSASVSYADPLGQQLPRRASEKSLGIYLDIVRRHPLNVAISYFRHTFNGLDIFYPTPYVKDIFAGHALFSLLNYLVWFSFLFYIFQTRFESLNFISLAATMALLAPVIVSIPVVVEVRFFLPLYTLAYGVFVFAFPAGQWISLLHQNRLNFVRLFALVIFFVMACFTLSASTVEHLIR